MVSKVLKRVDFGIPVGGGWTAYCAANSAVYIPIPAGSAGFESWPWPVPGVDWSNTRCGVAVGLATGVSFSVSGNASLGAYWTDYTPDTTSRQHYQRIEDLNRDVLTGWNSPVWATWFLDLARRYSVDVAKFIWDWQSFQAKSRQ